MEKVKIKLKYGATMPTKGTENSAGFDLYTCDDIVVYQGRNMIPTGVFIEMPNNMECQIRPRSGFSVKGFLDANGTRRNADVLLGTIDSDYRGEIHVIVKSDDTFKFLLEKGTRIAQMVFNEIPSVNLELSEELEDTERGNGGFGHTGTK